jgi:hypothetical protein
MNPNSDNETWLVEAGDPVIARRVGGVCLSPIERLVYCVWVAECGMRNAGDVDTTRDLYPDFQREAIELDRELGMGFTGESFLLPSQAFQAQYFKRFDRIRGEITDAEPGAAAASAHRVGLWYHQACSRRASPLSFVVRRRRDGAIVPAC